MDIYSKETEKLFEKIAAKHGVHKNTVKMIVSCEFEMVKQTMKKADSYNNFFPYIRLPFLGVFKIKKGKQKFLINKNQKVLEDVYPKSEQSND